MTGKSGPFLAILTGTIAGGLSVLGEGGEHRVSNFVLWNLAYTELYFCDTLWPDFGDAELELAFRHFAGRERRFGLTGAQVQGG